MSKFIIFEKTYSCQRARTNRFFGAMKNLVLTDKHLYARIDETKWI